MYTKEEVRKTVNEVFYKEVEKSLRKKYRLDRLMLISLCFFTAGSTIRIFMIMVEMNILPAWIIIFSLFIPLVLGASGMNMIKIQYNKALKMLYDIDLFEEYKKRRYNKYSGLAKF